MLAFLVPAIGLDATRGVRHAQHGRRVRVFIAAGAGDAAAAAAGAAGHRALVAGGVEDGPRQVVLEPLGVIYARARSSCAGAALRRAGRAVRVKSRT